MSGGKEDTFFPCIGTHPEGLTGPIARCRPCPLPTADAAALRRAWKGRGGALPRTQTRPPLRFIASVGLKEMAMEGLVGGFPRYSKQEPPLTSMRETGLLETSKLQISQTPSDSLYFSSLSSGCPRVSSFLRQVPPRDSHLLKSVQAVINLPRSHVGLRFAVNFMVPELRHRETSCQTLVGSL